MTGVFGVLVVMRKLPARPATTSSVDHPLSIDSQMNMTNTILYIPKGMKVWFLMMPRRNFMPRRAKTNETMKPVESWVICEREKALAFL